MAKLGIGSCSFNVVCDHEKRQLMRGFERFGSSCALNSLLYCSTRVLLMRFEPEFEGPFSIGNGRLPARSAASRRPAEHFCPWNSTSIK